MFSSCSRNPEHLPPKEEYTVTEPHFNIDTVNNVIVDTDTIRDYQNLPVNIDSNTFEPSSVSSFDQNKEIVHFRVQNTFNNSDKTHACYISIDEDIKALTLQALNGSDIFKLTSEGGSIFMLDFYNAEGLQASKRVYRRVDMEGESNAQIYTSRTGEITLTLSNP